MNKMNTGRIRTSFAFALALAALAPGLAWSQTVTVVTSFPKELTAAY